MGEALAAIGFAIGAAGFVVSTVDKLRDKASTIKSWKQKFMGFECRLVNYQETYSNWEKSWRYGDQIISDDEIRSVLGHKHLQDRAKNLKWIRQKAEQVVAAIKRGDDPLVKNSSRLKALFRRQQRSEDVEPQTSREDEHNIPSQAEWQTWANAAETKSIIDPSIANKIIDELQSAIQTLISLSKEALTDLQELDIPQTGPPGELVHRVFTICARREKFCSLLTRWHCKADWTSASYGIVMREHKQYLKCLRHENPVAVDMLVAEPPSSSGEVTHRIRLSFPHRDLGPVAEGKLEILTILEGALGGLPDRPETKIECPTSVPKTLRAHSNQQQKNEPEFSRIERTLNAVRVTYWVLLLWKTPWTTYLCPCQIARYGYQSRNARVVLTKHGKHPSTASIEGNARTDVDRTSWIANHVSASVHASDTHDRARLAAAERFSGLCESRRQLLCLALTLCEIALGVPVDLVPIQDDGLWFSINGRKVDQAKLLEDVFWMTSEHTRSAMEWCFKRVNSHTAQPFRHEDVFLFSSKILKLLEECHEHAKRPDQATDSETESQSPSYTLSGPNEGPSRARNEIPSRPRIANIVDQASGGAEQHDERHSGQLRDLGHNRQMPV